MRLPRRCAVGEEQVARGKSLGSTVDQQRMARKRGGGADHSDVVEAHDKHVMKQRNIWCCRLH